jgi:hypothetical protein
MGLNFPNNPINGQIHEQFGKKWQWSSITKVWTSYSEEQAFYVHPTGFASSLSNLSGPTVVSDIFITTEGHVSGIDTRVLTPTDIGAASLVDGKIPASELPSYVDDVLEFNDIEDFPEEGESAKIYISKDTNLTYRWSGTQYTEISSSLALGTTSSTAFRGDYGQIAYDHSQNSYTKLEVDTSLAEKSDKISNLLSISADYTLQLSDSNKINMCTNSSNITLTIPLEAAVNFPVGVEIIFIRQNSGTVTFLPTSGVTLQSIDNKRKIKGQFGSAALLKIGIDTWALLGSLEV